MRQAFELAFMTCGLFSNKMPVFLSMDDVHFIKPVEIGSVLALTSKVVYTASDAQDQQQQQEEAEEAEEPNQKTGGQALSLSPKYAQSLYIHSSPNNTTTTTTR